MKKEITVTQYECDFLGKIIPFEEVHVCTYDGYCISKEAFAQLPEWFKDQTPDNRWRLRNLIVGMVGLRKRLKDLTGIFVLVIPVSCNPVIWLEVPSLAVAWRRIKAHERVGTYVVVKDGVFVAEYECKQEFVIFLRSGAEQPKTLGELRDEIVGR